MKTYEEIKDLIKETKAKISTDSEEWKKFLKTASRFTKYSFEDQLIIYAQKPDAMACASADIWTNIMRCNIKQLSEGIELIDKSHNRLKFVYDVLDVKPIENVGKKPVLWEMRENDSTEIVKYLENIYGNVYGNIDESLSKTFGGSVVEISETIINDYLKENSKKIPYEKLLYNEKNMTVNDMRFAIRDILSPSLSAMILNRCGKDEELINHFYFEEISRFNTPEKLEIMGNILNDISKDVFGRIQEKMRILTEERSEKSKDISSIKNEEIIKNETAGKTKDEQINRVENVKNMHYNALKRESENVKQENILNENIQEKGSFDYDKGTGSKSRRDSRVNGSGQVWENERKISEGLQRGTVSDVHREQHTETAFSRNEREDARDDREPSGANVNNRSSTRQDDTSIRVGAAHELSELHSRGDGKRPDTIHLENNDKDFLNNLVDDILLTGSGRKNGRDRIFIEYAKGKSSEYMVNFLKNEYGTLGKGFTVNDEKVSFWSDDKGIKIAKGENTQDKEKRIELSWENVEEKIYDLIEKGKYITYNGTQKALYVEQKELASRLFFFFRDNHIENDLIEKNVGFPEMTDKLYYMLDDGDSTKTILEELRKSLQKSGYNEKFNKKLQN